ncbi:MAG: hypothetical protein C0614_04250 [Desulfuromonas sp.]|nr:MAG: hypothetical protein C0614_04250 [Desulfuromonas sp.]
MLCLTLVGCVASQIPSSPTSAPLQQIVRLTSDQLFSANVQGTHVAYTDSGLWLCSLDTRHPLKIDPIRPLAFSWSDNGERLAAVFALVSGETRLAVYSRDGQLRSEDVFPVEFVGLHWSQRGDLLLAGYVLKNYRFGSNLSQTLLVVDSSGVRTEITLGDTTLNPSTVKRYRSTLRELLKACFTASGDELVYTRLHDPPEFPSYLQLVFRNWQGGPEKLVAQLEPGRYDFQFTNNNTSLWATPQGRSPVHVPLWSGAVVGEQEVKTHQVGQNSLDGVYRFTDGVLYAGSRLIASWPPGSRLQFLAGGRFLFADQYALYLGSGLQAETLPAYRESDWTLRRWLHQGLISLQDYLKLTQEQQ